MRKDALGLFWRDEPIIKIKKEKVKCVPPEPIWLNDDYLPGLDEAEVLAGVEELTDAELIALAHGPRQEFCFDIEVYRNYYLAGFKHRGTGKVVFVESTPDGLLDTENYPGSYAISQLSDSIVLDTICQSRPWHWLVCPCWI